MTNTRYISAYAEALSRPVDAVAKDLESYANLLRKWQKVQNLVSRETLNELWTRHFADSLQALSVLSESDRLIMDIGSGGGFPALPMAIGSKGDDRKFVLVEPTSRKVSFLRTVARELSLNVEVFGKRTDEIDSRETGVPDVITSRALAALPQLCEWMHPFFGENTRAVLHKGREHVEEIKQARTHWDFDVLTKGSDTDPGGVILTITGLKPRLAS
jgi:16S rRNA (guanine527-N7)-methyltransferase